MHKKFSPPEYVGFGMLTHVSIMVLDKMPRRNTGAIVQEVNDFVFDDAAIIACVLRQWDVPSGMIGTAVGDDLRGHALAEQLKEWGVQGEVRFTKEYRTPLEVDVSDRKGARTYFWERTPQILKTLDTADLSLMEGARILYADWYDGDHVLRAMDEANRLNIPVFVNLEHGHKDADVLEKFAKRATFCQAVTDDAQIGGKQALLGTARKLLKSGIQTAIITMAKGGCLVAEGRARRPGLCAARQSRGCLRGGRDLLGRIHLWLSQGLGPGVLCPFRHRGCQPESDPRRPGDVPGAGDQEAGQEPQSGDCGASTTINSRSSIAFFPRLKKLPSAARPPSKSSCAISASR